MIPTRPISFAVGQEGSKLDQDQITIQHRGPGDRWAVVLHRYVWQANSQKEHGGLLIYEPLPSERSEEFLATTRFPLEEAKKLAGKLYGLVESGTF